MSPTDISGVGYLFPADKAVEKSRLHSLDTNQAHNLDQPFYYQYIPATDRPTNSSGSPYDNGPLPTGITGADGSGFNGFWWNGGDTPYKNWEFAWIGKEKPYAVLQLPLVPLDSGAQLDDLTYRPLPYGNTGVTVYTDEHGEANIQYVPGMGFYFDNLGVLKNSNGGCDVEPVATLGTADVSVTARYPYPARDRQ